jgi:hypothetical protein
MTQTVRFEWKEQAHEIPLLRAREAPAVMEIGEKMEAEASSSEQYRLALLLAEALHCPTGILDELPASEIVQFVVALQAAQMGTGGTGEKAPFEGGGESKSPAAPPVAAEK